MPFFLDALICFFLFLSGHRISCGRKCGRGVWEVVMVQGLYLNRPISRKGIEYKVGSPCVPFKALVCHSEPGHPSTYASTIFRPFLLSDRPT